MNIKLLTEHHLEFLSLTGGCTGSSESTLVKIPHCSKSHVAAHKVTVNSKSMGLVFSLEFSIVLVERDIFKGICTNEVSLQRK